MFAFFILPPSAPFQELPRGSCCSIRQEWKSQLGLAVGACKVSPWGEGHTESCTEPRAQQGGLGLTFGWGAADRCVGLRCRHTEMATQMCLRTHRSSHTLVACTHGSGAHSESSLSCTYEQMCTHMAGMSTGTPKHTNTPETHPDISGKEHPFVLSFLPLGVYWFHL